jgi:hypothetical protein
MDYAPIIVNAGSFLGGAVAAVISAYIIEARKAKIGIMSKHQMDFSDQQREAILTFYDTTAEILVVKMATNILELPNDGSDRIREYGDKVKELFSKHAIDWFRLRLFVRDETEMAKRAGDVFKAAQSLFDSFDQHFLTYGRNIQKCRRLAERESPDQMLIGEHLKAATAEYLSARKPTMDQLANKLERFSESISEHLRSMKGSPVPELIVSTK